MNDSYHIYFKGEILFKNLSKPIGETDHFIWFITNIGIVALFKREENFETYSANIEIEANKIALDITKEEKEYLKIKERQLFLFYS